jgi:hypothetical protein
MSRDFHLRFFLSNRTPWAPDSRAKAFLNSLRIRRDMIDFQVGPLNLCIFVVIG